MDHYYFAAMAMVTGLFSAPHCIGMCGGIAGALSMTVPATSADQEGASARVLRVASHNAGRLASYLLLGLLAGGIGFSLTGLAPILIPTFRILAGLLMIAMGLYIGGWWTGLKLLENAGFRIWQGLTGTQGQMKGAGARAFRTGLLWGFLPCGLVYTMMSLAMATASVIDGGVLMFAFGVGTLPTLVASGYLAGKVTSLAGIRQLRSAMGFTVMAFGLWTALSVIWMSLRM